MMSSRSVCTQNVNMGQVLERPHLVLCQGALPTNMEHRAFRSKRGGHPGHCICTARTSRCNNTTQSTGLAGVTVCSVSRRLLMANVDYSNPFVQTSVVDVDDMSTAQGENSINAFLLGRLGIMR